MRYRLGALTAQTIVDAGKNTEECVYIASLRGGGGELKGGKKKKRNKKISKSLF